MMNRRGRECMKINQNLKHAFIFVVLACLLLGMTACVGVGKSSSGTSAKTKISVWTIISAQDIETLKTNVIGNSLPDISPEFVTIPSNEYEHKLRIAISGGSAPDVFYIDGVYTSNYAYMGVLLPLDKYWDKDDFSDYVQSSQDKCVYNGKIYAASLFETACVLYYNKDLFAKAGITNAADSVSNTWTFDQLLDAAKKLTVKDSSGKTAQYGIIPGMNTPEVNAEGTTFTDLLWLWNHGGEAFDSGVTTAKGYFDSDKSIKAIQDYADLFQKYKVSPLEAITQGFETGKVAMWIGNVASSNGYIKNFPNLKFGVMPIPRGEKNYTSSGGWNIGISAQCKQPDAAWKLVKAITGKDGHPKFCDTFNYMPSRKSAFTSMANLDQFPMNIAKQEMLSNPRARPITPAYAELSTVIADTFNAAAYGGDVKSLTTKAVVDLNRILAKYPK